MKIERGLPPNFDAIVKVFPHAIKPTVLFAYGDTIYTRGSGPIDPSLIAHEETHCSRQGGDPVTWWDRYLRDEQFRFEEELAAHVSEFMYVKYVSRVGRSEKRRAHRLIANRLAGPMYGGLITKARAHELIERYADMLVAKIDAEARSA